jgi:hypothetical protein
MQKRRSFVLSLLLLGVLLSCRRTETVVAGFENAEAGWGLTLPASWDEERWRVLTPKRAGEPKPLHATLFVYLPEDTALRPEALLEIAVHGAAEWKTLAAEPGPPPGELLAERDGRAYVASLPQSNPYPPGSDAAKGFETMTLTPDAVKRAFHLR